MDVLGTTLDSARQKLLALERLLIDHDALWRHRPFLDLSVPWKDSHSLLYGQLLQLDLEQAELLERVPDAPTAGVPELRALHKHIATAIGPTVLLGGEPRFAENPPRWVPGKKWWQIREFGRAVLGSAPADLSGWVDWCAGKSHLGRAISKTTGLATVALERDATLCAQGRSLARQENAPVSVLQTDVLRGDVLDGIPRTHGVMALHSCGRLHEALLRLAARRRQRFVAVSPCCYHNIPTPTYVPLSAAANSTMLELSPDELRLATQDEVTAGAGRRDLRRRAQIYRLAYDILAREASGCDAYQRFDRVPACWYREPLRDFLPRVFVAAGLRLPSRWNPEAIERAAADRLRRATALSVVRGLFRRPLERWLLLDRAIFLIEQGYEVHLGFFCERTISPRNHLLTACAPS